MSDDRLPKALLGEAVENGAQKRVLSSLDDRAAPIAAAIRRAVPIFIRRGIEIAHEPTKVGRARDLFDELRGPVYHIPLVTDPGGSRAMLCIEGAATSFLLDAALGALIDENSEVEPPTQLTGPQSAVLHRLADGLVSVISDVVSGAGLRLKRLPPAPIPDNDGELAALTFLLANREDRRIVLAVSRDAIATAGGGTFQPPTKKAASDQRVARILSQVELELVVELGRVRRKLSVIDGFRVGDVLRLDAPARDPLSVRVQGKPILRAQPTVSGTQLAVQVVERIDGFRPRLEGRDADPDPT
jgi:flagellar motor switch/type III secretory pathway protein FliN